MTRPLRLVLDGDPPRDLEVDVREHHARLRDVLVEAGLDPDPHDPWWIDGEPVRPDTALADLVVADGAVVGPGPTRPALRHATTTRACRPSGGVIVSIVAGPGAGTSHHLPTGGTAQVGRGPAATIPLASATVSARQARLRATVDGVVVEDQGSSNGTWVDGVCLPPHDPVRITLPATLRLGASVVRISPSPGCDRPRGRPDRLEDGRWAFNRPPPPTRPADVAPVVVPVPPPTRRGAQALRWAGVVVPVAMGAVLVVVTGNPRFALFLLLSPVMAVAGWWSSRRRDRSERRTDDVAWADALHTFDQDLGRARRARVARRDQVHPDLAEVVRRATEPSRRLWERRPDHPQAYVVRIGSGDLVRDPPLLAGPGPATSAHGSGGSIATGADPHVGGSPDEGVDGQVDAIVARHRVLPAAAATVDLRRTRVVGVVGHRRDVVACARALLVHLATLHGPADLRVAVATSPARRPAWAWSCWLPHTEGPATRLVAADRRAAVDVVDQLRRDPTAARPGEPVPDDPAQTVVVVDDVGLLSGPASPVRDLLAPTETSPFGIVLADHRDQLPAACTTVVTCRDDGVAEVVDLTTGATDDVVLAGLDEDRARRVALALAHLADPEQARADRGLPSRVRLHDLLTPDDVVASEPTTVVGTHLSTPIGVGADGPVSVDLVADGPHVLVGGTTGSGKSELLRSLVAGLAARHGVDQVVFVLLDYKGGAAFRDCARLPHTVGLVTDLDDHLGSRALLSLEAELRRREQLLADAGEEDLAAYLRAGAVRGPLPRLVVVVDEFATLAAELPDFVDALVGIAQRGRSLGVHLVLATQRPRGSVDANVRANTNLRIALRVQDAGDSLDIIDRAIAADLPRDRPGRLWIRRGPGELVLVQGALASARSRTGAAPVVVTPWPFASSTSPPHDDDTAPTDLSRLVGRAWSRVHADGTELPRRPWLPMLADDLALVDLLGDHGGPTPEPAAPVDPCRGPCPPHDHEGVVVGMLDLPGQQQQVVATWRPDEGNLVALGPIGSGTTTLLATVAAASVATRSPDDLHLYVLDAGGDGLGHLADLPHTGTHLRIDRVADHVQLLGWLAGEVRRRQALPDARRTDLARLLVVVDNLSGLMAVHDDPGTSDLRDHLGVVLQDGPAMRVATAVATERLAGIPASLRAGLGRTLVLGHPDDRDLSLVGLRRPQLPDAVAGRAVDAATATVLQVARPPDPPTVAGLSRRHHLPATRPPHAIRSMPDVVAFATLGRPHAGPGLTLPMGVDRVGRPSDLVVHPGDHVVVTGPARSGRTTTLQVLSTQLRRARPDAIQVALCDETRSDLHGWPSLDAAGSTAGLATILDQAVRHDRCWFVLVDDVRWCGDDSLLDGLVDARADLHLVVAGRPDDLRRGFGGWRRSLRTSRTGILLRPDLTQDGELVGARLPRRVHRPMGPGRGFLVNGGSAELTQFAGPPQDPEPGSIAA